MMHFLRLLISVGATTVLAACTTIREAFPGHEADEVWTAMVAAARTPDYNHPDYTRRWMVRENQVWVDDENSRIEIFRRVERDLYRPASKSLQEQREWKIQAALGERDPPTIRFRSRQVGVPAHAWDEAERYFDDVWELLGGRPDEQNDPGETSINSDDEY